MSLLTLGSIGQYHTLMDMTFIDLFITNAFFYINLRTFNQLLLHILHIGWTRIHTYVGGIEDRTTLSTELQKSFYYV